MVTDTSQPSYFVDSKKGNIKTDYHFEGKLAQGGFGVVYKAEHRTTKEKYAVKAI
jgi:serine/threonine protein kinase